MRLVYLYGPPGVGKLTVARELVALTGFKLLHNHLTVNLVKSIFPFNSEPYIRLMRQFRRDMVAEAARVGVDLVVTGVYIGTEEQLGGGIRRMIEPVYAAGGSVLFVQLVCDRDVWLARVANESRRAEDKLTDPERAVGLFDGRDPFSAMPLEPTLRIDTTHLPPMEAAEQIMTHYGLPLVAGGERRGAGW
jgi:hypothetical protein